MPKITYIFLWMTTVIISQERTFFNGKVVGEEKEIEGITIVNLTKSIGTITDKKGYFKIEASPGDVVRFSSVQHEVQKYVVRVQDLNADGFRVVLQKKVNTLEEVIISPYSLSGKLKEDLQAIPNHYESFPRWNAEELKRLHVDRPNDAQSPVENLLYARWDVFGVKANVEMSAIGNTYNKIVHKKKIKEEKDKAAIEAKMTISYLVNELKIPETDYYDFLDFLKENPKTLYVLRTKDQLKLMEYVKETYDEFLEKYR